MSASASSMVTSAQFPVASLRAGMYESFFARAVSPDEPEAVWIRYTVHKRPGRAATGSVWCTVFDGRRDEPLMLKLTTDAIRATPESWIEIGAENEIGPGALKGCCGEARWSLRFDAREPGFRHLSPDLLYRLPLPRTKLTSPAPIASFNGTLRFAGGGGLEVNGWSGMVGHNWGSEHAERWIWLHGLDFAGAPDAWIDLAVGRLRIAGRMTPWIANGALSYEGRRFRLGGLFARGLRVTESPGGCTLRVAGEGGLTLDIRAVVPAGSAAGWRYADPTGGQHDVINCSIAALEMHLSGLGQQPRTLCTAHGGVYELGTRERDHGVPVAPFPDG